MTSIESSPNFRLAVLVVGLTAAVLVGSVQSARSDTLACLRVLQPGCTLYPLQLIPGACGAAPACNIVGVNVCLSTAGTAGPGAIGLPTIMGTKVTLDEGVAGVAGLDCEGDPVTQTGHCVLWVDPAQPVAGGVHAGISDEFGVCPE